LNFLIELRLIHQDIRSLREENRNQNIKIAQLEEVVESQDIIKRVDQKIHNKQVSSRQKWPYKLLPSRLAINHHRFYGPSTNCSDLSKLGHTLNGFYLVKPANNTDDTTQPDTIYCAIQQPEGIVGLSNVEKRNIIVSNNLGHNTVSGVHFHVSNQISSGQGFKDQDVLKFDTISLNMGGSFDASNGVFTAPKSGVYRFIFKGMVRVIKDQQLAGFHIELNQNGNVIGNSLISSEDQVTMIETTVNLDKGDKIFLTVAVGDGVLMSSKFTTFSGSLLD